MSPGYRFFWSSNLLSPYSLSSNHKVDSHTVFSISKPTGTLDYGGVRGKNIVWYCGEYWHYEIDVVRFA